MPIASDVVRGARVLIPHPELVNLYGCILGDDSKIGPFVEIQAGVVVGRACKISSHSFLCTGVVLGDEVFVGHGVTFVNDRDPRAARAGAPRAGDDFTLEPTRVEDGASIGSGAVVLCGITIGRAALVGAGAVVTRDVPADAVVAGNPARVVGDRRDRPEPHRVAGRMRRNGWLAAAVILFVVAVRFAEPIQDGDLFWHLAYARQMLERGTLQLDHTAFSWMPATTDMIYVAWLAELALYALWERLGAWSLFALRYLVVATVAGLAWAQARRLGSCVAARGRRRARRSCSAPTPARS